MQPILCSTGGFFDLIGGVIKSRLPVVPNFFASSLARGCTYQTAIDYEAFASRYVFSVFDQSMCDRGLQLGSARRLSFTFWARIVGDKSLDMKRDADKEV